MLSLSGVVSEKKVNTGLVAQARGNMFYLILSREVNVDRSSMSIQASQGYTETSVVLLL